MKYYSLIINEIIFLRVKKVFQNRNYPIKYNELIDSLLQTR
jgi:hypothetical protein